MPKLACDFQASVAASNLEPFEAQNLAMSKAAKYPMGALAIGNKFDQSR